MTGYVLSPRAQADLAEIWDYTEGRWGTQQAERYVRQLKAGIEAVAADPLLGAPCEGIRAGYRKQASGSHVLFYRMLKNRVDIVRILHSRMDYLRHI